MPRPTNNDTVFLEKIFPDERHQCDASNRERGDCFEQVREKLPLIPNCVGAMDAKLGQLVLRGKAHDTLTPTITLSECSYIERLNKPGDEGDERHKYRRDRARAAETDRVAASNSASERRAVRWRT